MTSSPLAVLRGLAVELRPWQWYKQGILLLGVIFSGRLSDVTLWMEIGLAVVAFTLAAGSVYLLNDLKDLDADRAHPKKRTRPIASGAVPVPVAWAAWAVCLAVALLLSWLINAMFLVVVATYVLLNVVYSLLLRDVVLIDLMVIALGFVLRAVAGVVAIGVFLSPWLIVCTLLAALMLGIGKRRHELDLLPPGSAVTRATLKEYTKEGLDQLLTMVMSSLIMAYSLYTFFRAEQAMMLTLPFAFYAIFRYHHLVHTTDIGGSPERILRDRASVINFALWFLTAVAVLYHLPERVLP